MTTPKDKLLFTPGPLTTSGSVKKAMMHDLGSRDGEFIRIVREVRERLLAIGYVSQEEGYEAVLMQGSGTFGIESVISSTIPSGKKILVVINGAYGERMVKIARALRIETVELRYDENRVPSAEAVAAMLAHDEDIHTIAVVHCETTTGIINPIGEIGAVVRKAGRNYFVDAMSSFGAVPIDVGSAGIDFLVSSANKCIEGVPGFSFILANKRALERAQGIARSVSFDLYSQWIGLEESGQFRFTPPTHAILAFYQALLELENEGGVLGRSRRYSENHSVLLYGMEQLGFESYLENEHRGYIITSFHYPRHPQFVFEHFYEALNRRGMVIYPGKLSKVDCFRIGNIGRLFPDDIHALLAAVREALTELGIPIPVE